MAKVFQINVTVEHGQLHESLDSDDDRQLMIDRLQKILLDTTDDNKAVREGVIQILIDQLKLDNGHEPLFVRTGLHPEEKGEEEQIQWVSKIIERRDDQPNKGQPKEIEVKVDKYRKTGKTPINDPAKPGNPFKLSNPKGREVASEGHKSGNDSKAQKFYKFSIEAEDGLGHKLTLDPCIICDR